MVNCQYSIDFFFFGHCAFAWYARQVADAGKVKRKKGMFGRQTVDKEVSALLLRLHILLQSVKKQHPLMFGLFGLRLTFLASFLGW